MCKNNVPCPCSSFSLSPPKAPWNILSQEDPQPVKDFYTSEEVWWTSPLTRDFIRLPGSNEKTTRYYLICSLTEAYGIFQEKRFAVEIRLSKFCSLKPAIVKLNREASVKDFRFHCFIKSQQWTAFNAARSIPSSFFVVVQVDFAENFSCNVQVEITAFHFFGGNQVCFLLTIVLDF
jgi:hypothetical protein